MDMTQKQSKKFSGKVQSGGRVQIDADIRRELNIDMGDYVIVSVEPLNGGNDE